MRNWEGILNRWTNASLLDANTAECIRDYERQRESEQGLRWPVLLAIAFGAVMLAAGVLLFVAAHWDDLSPAQRFSLVLLMVAIFHLAGAFISEKFSGLATALHGIGTATLGAGIFLAGQIFNLQEHWPGGIMLWALGAAAGWWLLRDWVQATMFALLAPAWLASEWIDATDRIYNFAPERILLAGVLLLGISYFTALTNSNRSHLRLALRVMGALAILPAAGFLAAGDWDRFSRDGRMLSWPLAVLGWMVALAVPLGVAVLLRKRDAWMNAIAAVWIILLSTVSLADRNSASLLAYAWHELGGYFLCALGAIGMIAWGLYESRKERVNLGVIGFGLTILVFYSSEVMDKLGRSASLIGLGILFLLGGWIMEKTRRRLVAKVKVAAA